MALIESTGIVISNSEFNNNHAAERGSAIYLSYSNAEIEGSIFSSNVAKGAGGGIYWVAAARMAPSLTENIFSGNKAMYGNDLATEAVSIELMGRNGSESHDNRHEQAELTVDSTYAFVVTVYDGPVKAFSVVLLDFYKQKVLTDSSSYTEISVARNNYSCNSDDGYVTGGTVQRFENGQALFDSLEVRCSPSGSMLLLIETDVAIDRYFPVSFRSCYRGEYYSQGMCLECPTGSYSLKDNSDLSVTTCEKCPDEAESCFADQLVLKEGYWRISADASSAIPCPLGSRSCIGGNKTGSASCVEGYEVRDFSDQFYFCIF